MIIANIRCDFDYTIFFYTIFLKEEMDMPLTKINTKIVFLLFVFAISTIFIFYSENNGRYPDNIPSNLSNNSTNANVHSGDLIQKKVSNARPGDTVIVYPGDSIQQKINNVNSCDTILVYPGLYKENLVVDKPLSIVSKQGKSADTVIQAANPEKDVFHITANNVTISGFNITGSRSKAGIYYTGSNSSITGNTLVYNKYGAFLKSSSDIVIRNNTVFQNEFGIYLRNSSKNTLENNEANDSSHYGIFIENSTENELDFNIVNSNSMYAVCLKNSNNNWLKNNNISNNELKVDVNGINLENSNSNKLISNYISNSWKGVNLTNSSDNELGKNRVSHNYFSISLQNSNGNKLLNNTIEMHPYTFSITLGNSQNNIIKGNTVGLNKETADMNKEIKVFYNPDSRNNTIEGELYTDHGRGTGVFREE